MHSQAHSARLRSNRKAYNRFERFRGTYRGYVKDCEPLFSKHPAISAEGRVFYVRQMIMDLEPNIWGLGTNSMPALEVADLFARLVVGR